VRANIEDNRLYTAEQTRELDRLAIEGQGIPGIQLMSRAGRVTFELVLHQYPATSRLQIFCGTGNNGGDGFIVAALARRRGLKCRVYQVGDAHKITGDAQAARQQALEEGVEIVPFSGDLEIEEGVIVDALLGTGLRGEVSGDSAAAIGLINSCTWPVVAVDIPSGLCSDSGRRLGEVVAADHTVAFIGLKRGQFTGAAAAVCGVLHFADLDVPPAVYAQLSPAAERLQLESLLPLLPRRAPDAHKGNFGHVLVIGGDHGMAGAALLAGEAAARCGAGLVSVATRELHVAALVARRPELMVRGVEVGHDLQSLLENASVVAVGPGLGQTPWSEQLLHRAADSGLPMVVDADALNLLAKGRVPGTAARDNWILTPHPGEAARLLGIETREVQADRFAAVVALQQRFGGVVLLKGAGTLVCDGRGMFVSEYGNPGMASGGMGDVLSGVLAALLAQGLDLSAATRLGVCLHGRAAEFASAGGSKGLLAADLMPCLRQLLGD
jgi:hydroxyethylthiazole kinase-like uncharacterized protein yjeF